MSFWDYRKYTDIIQSGAHVTPAFRDKYRQYIDWSKLPGHFVHEHFIPSKQFSNDLDHKHILESLGFFAGEETNHIIQKFEAKLADPLNWPLMAHNLSGLPPAYILACHYDTLRDDAILYSKRLQEAGNDVTLDYQRQGWHGYITFAFSFFRVNSAMHAFNNITRFMDKYISTEDG